MIGRGPWVRAPGSGKKPTGRATDRSADMPHSTSAARHGRSPRSCRDSARNACGSAGYSPVIIKRSDTAATPPRQNR